MNRLIVPLLISLLAGTKMVSASSEGHECSPPSVVKSSFCFKLDVKDKNTQNLRQLTVISGDVAFIQLVRRPLDKCTIQTKAEPLPQEAGATGIFSILAKTFAPATFVPTQDLCAALGTPPNSDEPQQAKDEDAALRTLASELMLLEARIISAQEDYREVALQVSAFASCLDVRKPPNNYCSDESTYDAYRQSLLAALQKTLLGQIPATGVLDLLAQKAQDSQKNIGPADWSSYEANRLSCYLGRLAGYKAALADLTPARQQLAKADDLIRSANWPEIKTQVLPSQKNAKLTATVSCSNLITGDPSMDPVNIVLTYKDVPRLSVSAGVLVTLTPKQVLGIKPINTGTSGTPSFKSIFALTDSASAQVVPLSLLNLTIRHWRIDTRLVTLNLAGGIGVNPNSGTKEVEFFTGPGLGIGNVYFHFGAHIGEFKNLGGGFVINGTVPDKFPSTVPITKDYTVHPAFTLSYRIPLP